MRDLKNKIKFLGKFVLLKK